MDRNKQLDLLYKLLIVEASPVRRREDRPDERRESRPRKAAHSAKRSA